jgi:cysteine synthase
MRVREGFSGTVGHTPLIRLESLSEATGCTILGKAEMLNPGGSVKDRAALGMVLDAEARGALSKGGLIVEGTAGNTGIGLCHVANARGYRCLIVMPDNVAPEKAEVLRALGAELSLVPPAPFAKPENYYHVARRLGEERGGFWADQFENPANFTAHYTHTGVEILEDAGPVDGFVTSAGTGGTIGGISKRLKEENAKTQCYLVDCEGSSLVGYVNEGTLAVEGSSVLEGIGIRRITKNFAEAKLDGAFLGTDREAVAMSHYLLHHDGLFLGGSGALNCVGAVKLARKLGRGATVVTVLCDGGGRYQSRLFNPAWLTEKGFSVNHQDLSFVS